MPKQDSKTSVLPGNLSLEGLGKTVAELSGPDGIDTGLEGAQGIEGLADEEISRSENRDRGHGHGHQEPYGQLATVNITGGKEGQFTTAVGQADEMVALGVAQGQAG